MQTEIKEQILKILRVEEIEFLNIDVNIENKTLSAFVCFDNRVVVVIMDNGVFWDTTTIEKLKYQVQEYFTLDFFENFTVLIVTLNNTQNLKEIRKTNFQNTSNMNYLF